MSHPLISVNMCVWRPNRDHFRLAVQSVLRQTMEDWELVIVEDPSEIDGRQIIADFLKDPRLKYVKNVGRTGLVSQRNQAMDLSQGEFVAFLDADDFAMPFRLERQLAFLNANPHVSIVGSWVLVMDNDGKIYGRRRYPKSPELVGRAMRRFCALAFPTVLIRKDVLRHLGGFASDSYVTDYDLWCRAVCAGYKCDNIPEELVVYRVHPSARTRSRAKHVLKQTIRVKLRHFGFNLGLLGWCRLLEELCLLLLPSRLIHSLFMAVSVERLSVNVPRPSF